MTKSVFLKYDHKILLYSPISCNIQISIHIGKQHGWCSMTPRFTLFLFFGLVSCTGGMRRRLRCTTTLLLIACWLLVFLLGVDFSLRTLGRSVCSGMTATDWQSWKGTVQRWPSELLTLLGISYPSLASFSGQRPCGLWRGHLAARGSLLVDPFPKAWRDACFLGSPPLCWCSVGLSLSFKGPGGALLFDELVLVPGIFCVGSSERPPTVGECASLVLAGWGFRTRFFCRAGAFVDSSNSLSLQIPKACTHMLLTVMGFISFSSGSKASRNGKSSRYLE